MCVCVCVCVCVMGVGGLNVPIATIASFRTMWPLFLSCFAAICCMVILRETISVSLLVGVEYWEGWGGGVYDVTIATTVGVRTMRTSFLSYFAAVC